MKLGFACRALTVVVTSALTASAMAVEISVDSEVSGCSTSDELAARLASSFDEEELPSSLHTLRVKVRALSGRGLLADVGWTSLSGEGPRRALEIPSRDCRQLDDALPLVARALWEAEAPTSDSPPKLTDPAPTSPPPRSPPAPPPFAPQRDRVVEPPARRGSFDLGLGAVGAVGVLDSPLLAGRLQVRAALAESWVLRVAGTYLSQQAPTLVGGGQVRFSALTGRVAGCFVPRLSFALDACLGVDAGVLRPHLQQVEGGAPGNRPLLWPLALLALRRPLVGPIQAEASFAAGPALARYDFYVRNGQGESQSVRASAPALVELALGLSVSLR